MFDLTIGQPLLPTFFLSFHTSDKGKLLALEITHHTLLQAWAFYPCMHTQEMFLACQGLSEKQHSSALLLLPHPFSQTLHCSVETQRLIRHFQVKLFHTQESASNNLEGENRAALRLSLNLHMFTITHCACAHAHTHAHVQIHTHPRTCTDYNLLITKLQGNACMLHARTVPFYFMDQVPTQDSGTNNLWIVKVNFTVY